MRRLSLLLVFLATAAHAVTLGECIVGCADELSECNALPQPAKCRHAVLRLCRAADQPAICDAFSGAPIPPVGTTTTTIRTPTPVLDLSGIMRGPNPPGSIVFSGAFPPHDGIPNLRGDVGFFVADRVTLRFPTRRVGPVLGAAWLGGIGSGAALHACPPSISIEQTRPNGTTIGVPLAGATALPVGKFLANPLRPGCLVAPNPAGNAVGWMFRLRGTGIDWHLPMRVTGLPFSGGVVLFAPTPLPTTSTTTVSSATSSSSTIVTTSTSTTTSSTSTSSSSSSVTTSTSTTSTSTTSSSSTSSTSTSSSTSSSSSTLTTSTTSSTTTSTVDPSLPVVNPLPPGASAAFGTFPSVPGDVGYYVADHVFVQPAGSPKRLFGPVLGFSQRVATSATVPWHACAADLPLITVHQLRPDGSELVVVLDPLVQEWHGTGKAIDTGPSQPTCANAASPAGNVVGWVFGLRGTGLEIWRPMTVEGLPFSTGPVVL